MSDERRTSNAKPENYDGLQVERDGVIVTYVGMTQERWELFEAWHRSAGKAPADEPEVMSEDVELLAAVKAWAEAYAKANPKGKYYKAREAILFDAVSKALPVFGALLPIEKRDERAQRKAKPDPNAPFSTLTDKGLEKLIAEWREEPFNDRSLAVLTLAIEMQYRRAHPEWTGFGPAIDERRLEGAQAEPRRCGPGERARGAQAEHRFIGENEVKIISEPSKEAWSRELCCNRCQTRVEVEITDFKRRLSDQRDGDAAVYVCPTCGAENWVDTGLIPRALHHRLPQ